jgi:hypothetical protein
MYSIVTRRRLLAKLRNCSREWPLSVWRCRLFGHARRGDCRDTGTRGKSALFCAPRVLLCGAQRPPLRCLCSPSRAAGCAASFQRPRQQDQCDPKCPHSPQIDELAKRSADMRLESDQLRSNAARLKSAIGSHQLALRRTAGSAPAHIGSGAFACTRMRACVCASQPGCTAHRRKCQERLQWRCFANPLSGEKQKRSSTCTLL